MKPREETKFGHMLRKYRSRHHMSQAQLADSIGVSQNTIHLWETRRCRPEMGSLQNLSELMGIPLISLLEITSR